MTIGIYKLNFKGTEKVYVGKSNDILGKRFKSHLRSFKQGTAPKKLLQGYLTFGTPTLEILCECTIEKLSELEDYFIVLYDAVSNGFNTLNSSEEIPCLYGEDNGSSKYSNEQIEIVFNLLIDTLNLHSYKEICNISGVLETSVASVANCNNHLWLEDKFPEKYKILRDLKGTRGKNSISYPDIKNPEGKVFTVEGLKTFAKEHNLNPSHLCEVLNKKAKSHKGWVLA